MSSFNEQIDLRAISFRQPWGYLVLNGFKKVENRSKKLNDKWLNQWLCLHISKKFDEQVVKNCLQNKLEYKLHQIEVTMNEMKQQCGKIVGFFKVSQCNKDSVECKRIDFKFTDYPHATKSHWIICKTIIFQPFDYVSFKGQLGLVPLPSAVSQLMQQRSVYFKLSSLQNC